jgi:hypothetical protein
MSNGQTSSAAKTDEHADPSVDPGSKTSPGTPNPFSDDVTSPNAAVPGEVQTRSAEEITEQTHREDEDDDQVTVVPAYDGITAPLELTGRDLAKIFQAPVQNREGRRARHAYEQIIKQFAVASNPRYDAESPDASRGHIFVSDVSRAMHCEIPHNDGGRELSLSQACAWMREKALGHGWRVIDLEVVLQTVADGHLVIALPTEATVNHLAVVPPQDTVDPSDLLLAGLGAERGAGLPASKIFGSSGVVFYTHD